MVISLQSVTNGQCDPRPTVTFPAYAGTKLYCLVTEAHVCEQLVQGCTRKHGSWELNPRTDDRKSSDLTTMLSSHRSVTYYLQIIHKLQKLCLSSLPDWCFLFVYTLSKSRLILFLTINFTKYEPIFIIFAPCKLTSVCGRPSWPSVCFSIAATLSSVCVSTWVCAYWPVSK